MTQFDQVASDASRDSLDLADKAGALELWLPAPVVTDYLQRLSPRLLSTDLPPWLGSYLVSTRGPIDLVAELEPGEK